MHVWSLFHFECQVHHAVRLRPRGIPRTMFCCGSLCGTLSRQEAHRRKQSNLEGSDTQCLLHGSSSLDEGAAAASAGCISSAGSGLGPDCYLGRMDSGVSSNAGWDGRQASCASPASIHGGAEQPPPAGTPATPAGAQLGR